MEPILPPAARGCFAGGIAVESGVEAPAQETQKNPERNAYFGETHLHTSFSTDAFIWQNRTTPDDAYR